MSIKPIMKRIKDFYWSFIESNALIAADVERHKANQAHSDAAAFERKAAFARSERNQY